MIVKVPQVGLKDKRELLFLVSVPTAEAVVGMGLGAFKGLMNHKVF